MLYKITASFIGGLSSSNKSENKCSYKPKFCPECGRILIEEDTK